MPADTHHYQEQIDRIMESVSEQLFTQPLTPETFPMVRAITFAGQRLAYYLERLEDASDHALPYTRVCLRTGEVREYLVQPYMATHKLIYETRAYIASQDLWLNYNRFMQRHT